MSLNPLQSLQTTAVCFGQITATPGQGTFTVPANQSALITSVRIANVHATVAATLNISVQPAGGSLRLIAKKDTSLAVGTSLVLSDYLTLGAGDLIKIAVTAVSTPAVDWSLEGVIAD